MVQILHHLLHPILPGVWYMRSCRIYITISRTHASAQSRLAASLNQQQRLAAGSCHNQAHSLGSFVCFLVSPWVRLIRIWILETALQKHSKGLFGWSLNLFSSPNNPTMVNKVVSKGSSTWWNYHLVAVAGYCRHPATIIDKVLIITYTDNYKIGW